MPFKRKRYLIENLEPNLCSIILWKGVRAGPEQDIELILNFL